MTITRLTVMAALLVLLCGCRIAGDTYSGGAPSATPTSRSAPTVAPSESASPSRDSTDPGEQLEQRLDRIDGIRDPIAVAAEDDLDCLPGSADRSRVVDIRFTARTTTAMFLGLRTGREAVKELDLSDVCVIGTFASSGDSIQVNATNDYVGGDWPIEETWPSATMIKKVIAAAGHRPDVGPTHLYWTATADRTDSDLRLGTDLDEESPTDARAITIFRRIERSWRPPKGFDRTSIFVSSTSGSLSGTQWGDVRPWQASVPVTLLTAYRQAAADFGDASVARRTHPDDDISSDQFDFLWSMDEGTIGWPARQRMAHIVIKAYFATPAAQRADSLGIRSGRGTALDFDTSGCEGILPGQDNRQSKSQTRTLYRWYATHYPKQAKEDGVDQC